MLKIKDDVDLERLKDFGFIKYHNIDDGQYYYCNLIRFIKWAKDKDGGSRITEINSLSGDFDIIKDVLDLLKGADNIE